MSSSEDNKDYVSSWLNDVDEDSEMINNFNFDDVESKLSDDYEEATKKGFNINLNMGNWNGNVKKFIDPEKVANKLTNLTEEERQMILNDRMSKYVKSETTKIKTKKTTQGIFRYLGFAFFGISVILSGILYLIGPVLGFLLYPKFLFDRLMKRDHPNIVERTRFLNLGQYISKFGILTVQGFMLVMLYFAICNLKLFLSVILENLILIHIFQVKGSLLSVQSELSGIFSIYVFPAIYIYSAFGVHKFLVEKFKIFKDAFAQKSKELKDEKIDITTDGVSQEITEKDIVKYFKDEVTSVIEVDTTVELPDNVQDIVEDSDNEVM